MRVADRRGLAERELDIMETLWSAGRPLAVGEVRRALAAAGHDLAYTTVQTILNRLERKGRVRRDTGARAHTYRPTLQRRSAAEAALHRLVQRFFDRSPGALAAHLVERDLSAEERQRLGRLLAKYRRERS